jgi:hypothetical protein
MRPRVKCSHLALPALFFELLAQSTPFFSIAAITARIAEEKYKRRLKKKRRSRDEKKNSPAPGWQRSS